MTTTTAPQKTGASLQFIAETFQIHRTYWFGPQEVKSTFGVEIASPQVPTLFSESVLRRAWEMNCCVVLQQDRLADGKPLTLQNLHASRENQDALGGKFLCDTDWYGNEPLFTTLVPRSSLFIKGRSVIPESTGKTFVGESLVAADFAEELFGDELPEPYGKAIEELRSETDRLEKLCRKDWQEGARQCVALSFSRFFRESPGEVLYRVLLAQKINRERLFENLYTRTNVLSPHGRVVRVGNADAGGARLNRWGPDGADDDLGFSFSCSGELEAVA